MFKNKFEKEESKFFDTTAIKLFLVISAISLAALNAGASNINLNHVLNLKFNYANSVCPVPYKYERCTKEVSDMGTCESVKNKFMKTFILPESAGIDSGSVCTQSDNLKNLQNES